MLCYSFAMVCDYMTFELRKVQTDTLLHMQVKHVMAFSQKRNYCHDISFTHD